VLAESDAAEM
jgi:hypothetical protein